MVQYTKAVIYNLALQALLLNKQISDPNNDKTNESKALNTVWATAFEAALADMDLDSTMTQENLTLLHDLTTDPPLTNGDPASPWHYIYKYPTNCAFFRRIVSTNVIDDKSTHHPKRVGIWQTKKVIFAKHQYAIGEFIAIDFPLQTLSAAAGKTLALRLAFEAASLIVGKGAKTLKQEIMRNYVASKAEAQQIDARESFSFQHDSNLSEFVKERLS